MDISKFEPNASVPSLDILLQSNSPIVVTDATLHDNPIIFVNSAFEKLTGYSSAEVLGKNCRFLQGEDRHQPELRTILAAISNNEACECLIRNYKKDGKSFWNKLYLFPLKDIEGNAFRYVGIQHDVSVERHLIEALDEKRQIIDSSPDAYLKIDSDLTILEANNACEKIFLWKPDDLIGNSAECLLPHDRVSKAQSVIHTLLLQSAPYRHDGEYLRKDGSTVFIDWVATYSASSEALLLTGRDVTFKRRVEREAAQANAEVRSVLESINEACFSLDSHSRITYVNQKGAELVTRAPGDLFGKLLWEEFPEAIWGELSLTCHTAMTTGEFQRCEQIYRGMWLEARAYPSATGLTVFLLDISDRKQQQNELVYLATHDPLTRLPNRNACLQRLTQLLSVEPPDNQRVACLFMDLDHFKEVNDAFGHRAGDSVLSAIGERLQGYANERCFPARISGDEFVLILWVVSEEDALDKAGQILASIAAPFAIAEGAVHIGASIGIAIANRSTSADELVNQADTAMYEAKAQGGYVAALFTRETSASISKRHRLRSELVQALESKQFVLHYQPQVSLFDGHLVGAEALIRWQHPVFGLLPPSEFLDIAEESPFVVEMGEWVIDEACRQLAQWHALGHVIKMSLNVSVRQLTDMRLAETMDCASAAYGIAPNCLKLEVTESMLAQNFDTASKVLGVLKQKGFRIALDDFGTGYSNLAYIKRLPVTTIKIDRSFINGIDVDESALALVNAIIALAKSLDLGVICEGVETYAQMQALQTTKCDTIQGYLISRPIDAVAFKAFLMK